MRRRRNVPQKCSELRVAARKAKRMTNGAQRPNPRLQLLNNVSHTKHWTLVGHQAKWTAVTRILQSDVDTESPLRNVLPTF